MEAKKHSRKVFGRREVRLGSEDFQIELRANALHVRKKWARRGTELSLVNLVDLAIGQFQMKL